MKNFLLGNQECRKLLLVSWVPYRFYLLYCLIVMLQTEVDDSFRGIEYII